MAKSESSAGDLAGELQEFLEKRYGTADWVDGESDVIGVEDINGVQLFVKVELA